jgi:Phage portal protein, lambda family
MNRGSGVPQIERWLFSPAKFPMASPIVDKYGSPMPPVAPSLNGNGGRSPGDWWGGGVLYNITPNSPQRKWRPNLLADACRMLPAIHYRELLSDARYIYTSGNGMVAGACHKKADYTIGDSWWPQYAGVDSAWRRVAEPYVGQWARTCELRGLPYTWNRIAWLASVCLDRDGDCFCLLTNDPDTGRPAFQFFEAHRIASPAGVGVVPAGGPYAGFTLVNGIAYDRFNRPAAYNLVPDNWIWGSTPVWNWLPARSVIHIFDPRWFSQGRGVPAISVGILDWFDMSEIGDAEKIAVKVNSSLALIEKNETGTHDPTPFAVASRSAGWAGAPGCGAKPQFEMLESGQIRYVKTNGEITSHSSDRPSSTFNGFMEHIARGACSGMDWPIEVAWNMASVGGAAVRAVVNQAQRSVNSRQQVLRDAFRSALLYSIGQMIESGELPFVDDWHMWTFTTPPKFSVDVGRDRQNQREDLAVGSVTLTEIVNANGGDTEAHLRTRAKDYKMALMIAGEEGVPVEVVYEPRAAVHLANQMNQSQDDQGDDTTDDGDQPQNDNQNQDGDA